MPDRGDKGIGRLEECEKVRVAGAGNYLFILNMCCLLFAMCNPGSLHHLLESSQCCQVATVLGPYVDKKHDWSGGHML